MSAYDDIRTSTDAAETEHIATIMNLSAAQLRIAELEQQLADCEGSGETYDVEITSGNLNAQLQAAGMNKRIKITGEYVSTLKPLSGQKLFGPFHIRGMAGDACNLKTANARNVEITDIEISDFTGRGLIPWIGSRIRNVTIHDLGANAMTGSYDNRPDVDILIEDFEFYNVGNPADASGSGVSAGGAKFTRSGPADAALGSSITMRRGYVHDVIGNGIWFDISCAGDVVEDCEITRCSQNGYRYEISMGPTSVDGLKSQQNTQHGVFVTSSAYFEANNVVVGGNGGRGILVIEEERAILPPDVPIRPMGTHEGFKFRDIKVLDYTANGDEVQVSPRGHPNVTLRPA